MSIKHLSTLLDSNPKQSNSNRKKSLDSEGIVSDPLEPKESKNFKLYSEKVKMSKHSAYKNYPEDRFTIFLSSANLSAFKVNKSLFWPDLQNLNLHELDESDYSQLNIHQQERLERIFKLYLDSPFSLSNIRKIKLRTKELNRPTSFRVFVILEANEYLVFLFDPLHLVITDEKTREDNVFEINKGNGICMSRHLD